MKKLIKLALIVCVVVCVAKRIAAKKAEWHGLTEDEVRAKLDDRLGQRVPDEKRAVIADTVVAKMRARGVLSEDSEPSEPSDSDGDAAQDDTETT